MTYTPPLDDMMFALAQTGGFSLLPEHAAFGTLDADVVRSILEPAAQLAAEVLAPLNTVGDREGASLKDGAVKTAPGFKDAYRQYCAGGWNSVPFDEAYGGQGLPWLVAFPLQEMWQGANMAFGLCPLLNQGAVEAIATHGSDAQKEEYLGKLISGDWTGTMNLTEPQAGSDLAAVRTKAMPQGDGSYKISGQKIFITYGEHDLTENIIHLVLARTPDAPEGVKGISLFIVPKVLRDGTRNGVVCAGIEHKLGIHGSPTCTMAFEDATGYLIGAENDGLKYMFTMMNNARLSVGLQGVAIAEAAYQKALSYARERMQGAPLSSKGKGTAPIAAHPDVKRMLLSMAAQVEAGRAMAYEAALALDLAKGGDASAQGFVDLMTPVVKAWCTDMAVDVASTGVQIHGGMGFVEETGAAQFYRDARILPIYEGTNGIQAADLLFRKVVRDSGQALTAFLEKAGKVPDALAGYSGDDIASIRNELSQALSSVTAASAHMMANAKENADLAAAVSAPFLKALALLTGGVVMAKAAIGAQEMLLSGENTAFAARKIVHARFFAENFLPQVGALAATVERAGRTILSADFL